ncbi:nitroreductase family protein [soil metagenome]
MALDDPAYVSALAQRYAAQQRPAKILSNPVIDSLLQHRSVRAYLSRPLPDGTIETLVAAAQSAASSSNLNLWSVVAVTDPAIRSQLAVLASNQRHIEEAPLILLWVADLARAQAVGEREARPTDALDFLDSFVTASVDTGLAAQNAVIAAESLGLGTVYIGALRNRPEAVAALVGLPPRAVVVFGLVVGWPDPDRPTAIKPRPAQAAVLHHDHYANGAEADAVEAYDAAIRTFQHSQGLPATGWKAPVLARFANAASLNGRDRLRAALGALGFPLR